MQFVVLDDAHDIADQPFQPGDAAPTNRRALAALRTILHTLKPEERKTLIALARKVMTQVDPRFRAADELPLAS